MKVVSSGGRALTMLVCACATLAVTAGVAQGTVKPHPHVGKLPGYPAIRGVVPVLNSKAAVSAHEKLVQGAFAAERSQHHALEANPGGTTCPEEFLFTQNVCYQAGPVLRDVRVHVIFWLGPNSELAPLTPNVKAFPNSYRGKIVQYFTDVAHDRNVTSDAYAVDPQYFDETGGGVNESLFSETDAVLDEKAFPPNTPETCSDVTVSSEGPCLLDSDIQSEVESVATKEAWGTGLGNIFFVFTPPGVGSCTEFGCAYQAYCAYHGDFGGEGVFPSAGQMIYANIPYAAPGVCDSGVHPNEATDEGTDGAIDVASHEFNESITDPLGSQCKSFAKKECEPFSWTDAIGQEIADKCLPPEGTVAGVYGSPLVEGIGALSFNQEINGHHYWTQREWSNEAGLFEGGCVQRAINASFTVSAGAQATVPMTLDGSASGAPGDPATYWVWNFGGGEQVGTASPTISHAFAQAGEQIVALTAYDRYGNAEATVESFNVGQAPAPLPPPAPTVITIKELVTPGHLTAGQVATKLGLRVTKLSGKGPFTLGRAECPPACAVTLQLYAKVPTAPGSRHSTKLVPIASARIALAAKGAKKLVLALNAKGRALLRTSRSLRCRLVVTVEGQEGGTWQIVRLPTLTGGGSAARRARR
jgi:PKD domain-containing protein